MKQKTTLFKTILLAAAMMSSVGAWADPTTIYERKVSGDGLSASTSATQVSALWSTNDIYDAGNDASTGGWTITTGSFTPVIDNEKGLNIPSSAAAKELTLSSISISGNSMLTYDLVWNIGGTTGGDASNHPQSFLKIGNSIIFTADPKGTSGNVSVDGGTTATSITNACSSNGGKRTDDNWTIHIEINMATKKVTSLTIVGESTTRQINTSLSNLDLPSDVTYSTVVIGNKYYGSVSGNSYTSLKSIKITETPQYTYSVHWKSGDTDMGEFTSGYDVNGASITIPYYRYLSTNHELYKISTANNTDVPTVSFTKTTEDQTEYMTGYTQVADAGYVVYCEEAENIEGMTPCSPYTSNRCSGRKAAYCSDYVTITTLPAGTYKVCIGMFGNASDQTFYVQAGETTVLERTFTKSSTRGEATSDAFTIDATTDIKIKGGVAGTAFDNIYIVCTSGRVASVDNLGYTFSSTLPLDFTGTDVRAYIATYDSGRDVMRLTNVTKVPANTGVLIFSNSALENQSIPVTTESTDDVTGNKLVAVNSAMTLSAAPEGYENYVLAIEEGKAVFQLVKTNSASMSAGQAYLQIPKRTSNARSLRIVFDDNNTTSINTIANSQQPTASSYYNLQGQRVEKPAKGLYIHKGKKVIVK